MESWREEEEEEEENDDERLAQGRRVAKECTRGGVLVVEITCLGWAMCIYVTHYFHQERVRRPNSCRAGMHGEKKMMMMMNGEM